MKTILRSLLLLAALGAGTLSAQTWGPKLSVSVPGETPANSEACPVDANRALVTYYDAASTGGRVALLEMNQGQLAKKGTLQFDDDGVISAGAPVIVRMVDANHFAVLYQDATPVGHVRVGRIEADGSLVWAGPVTKFSAPSKASFFELLAIGEGRVLVAYHGDTDKKGRVAVGTLQNGQLQFPAHGAQTVLTMGDANAFNDIAHLGGNRYVVAYNSTQSGGHVFLTAVSINPDNSLTGSRPARITEANTPYVCVAKARDGLLLVAYLTAQGPEVAVVKAGEDGSLNVLERKTLPDGAGHLLELAAAGPDRFVMTYRRDAKGRDTPVYLIETAGGTLKAAELSRIEGASTYPSIAPLHANVSIVTRIAGPQLEAQALAISR
jgi:hypothetical protein